MQSPEADAAVEHVELLDSMLVWWLMSAITAALLLLLAIGTAGDKEDDSKEGGKEGESDNSYSMGYLVRFPLGMACFYVPAIVQGVAQEFVMTNRWEDSGGHPHEIPCAILVVLYNRIGAVLLTGSIILLRSGSLRFSGLSLTALPAMAGCLASWCQYASLGLVTFQFNTAFRCSKLLPVLLIGTLRGKAHTATDYAQMCVIVLGMVIVGLESEGESGFDDSSTFLGVVFLCGHILFDAVTPHLQEIFFDKNTGADATQLTFGASLVSVGMITFVMLVNGTLVSSLRFLWSCPVANLHLFVLSLVSTSVQWTKAYVVKFYGPVLFTLLRTISQLVSGCLSLVLFQHRGTMLEGVSSTLVFSTLILRGTRNLAFMQETFAWGGDARASAEALLQARREEGRLAFRSETWTKRYWQLALCAISLYASQGISSFSEEHISTHKFGGETFAYPSVLVASSKTISTLVALCILKWQASRILHPELHFTAVPAATMFVGSLVYRYPLLAVLKVCKLIPTMLMGNLLNNRTYSRLDYLEGAFITLAAGVFVLSIQQGDEEASGTVGPPELIWGASVSMTGGAVLTVAYMCSEACAYNLEDRIYKTSSMGAAHLMLGEGAFLAVAAGLTVALSGQVEPSAAFVHRHPEALAHVVILGLAGALGTYTSALMVRLFGPMVFILVMTSRQIMSLVLSGLVNQHHGNSLNMVVMLGIGLWILMASLQRVRTQALPLGASCPSLEDLADRSEGEKAGSAPRGGS